MASCYPTTSPSTRSCVRCSCARSCRARSRITVATKKTKDGYHGEAVFVDGADVLRAKDEEWDVPEAERFYERTNPDALVRQLSAEMVALQAQGAKPDVIMLANAGADTVNSLKQAAQFGLTSGPNAIKIASRWMQSCPAEHESSRSRTPSARQAPLPSIRAGVRLLK